MLNYVDKRKENENKTIRWVGKKELEINRNNHKITSMANRRLYNSQVNKYKERFSPNLILTRSFSKNNFLNKNYSRSEKDIKKEENFYKTYSKTGFSYLEDKKIKSEFDTHLMGKDIEIIKQHQFNYFLRKDDARNKMSKSYSNFRNSNLKGFYHEPEETQNQKKNKNKINNTQENDENNEPNNSTKVKFTNLKFNSSIKNQTAKHQKIDTQSFLPKLNNYNTFYKSKDWKNMTNYTSMNKNLLQYENHAPKPLGFISKDFNGRLPEEKVKSYNFSKEYYNGIDKKFYLEKKKPGTSYNQFPEWMSTKNKTIRDAFKTGISEKEALEIVDVYSKRREIFG